MSKEKKINENETSGKVSSNCEERALPLEIPIVDAHMHIQSNDIAPLPIMNGMLRYKSSIKCLPKGLINFIYLSSRDIPHFEYDYDPKKDSIYETKDGKKNELFNLNPFRGSIFHKPEFSNRKLLTDATALITEYGVVTRHCSYSIAGLYQNENISTNLAYPSRWTKAKTANQDDIKKAKDSRNSILKTRQNQGWFNNYIQWYENATAYELKTDADKQILPFYSKPKMACVMGMELMYSHFWGAYGIPIYLEDVNGNIYTIDNFPEYKCSKGYDGQEVTINTLNYPYDMKLPLENNDGCIDLNNCKEKKLSNTQRYSIFLQKLEDKSETYRFEDHLKHVEYQKIAALRYPFQLLPFYHVEPRRFYAPVEDIKEKFDFYVPTEKTGIYKKEDSIIDNITKKNNGKIASGENFNYSISEEQIKNELLWSSNGKLGKGLFWGVKLYVALGYPPYIGCNGKINGNMIFPKLNKPGKEGEKKLISSYQKFTEFLNWCGDNDVPVTCHGSPQGMTIADSEIYLKEYLKQNDNSEFRKQTTSEFEPHCKGMMLGLGLIDDFSSPESWKVVLDEIKSKELRLCLAHFGGKPYFVDEYLMKKDPYSWQEQVKNLIYDSDKKIYTDLSNFMFRKVGFPNVIQEEKFTAIIEKYPELKKTFVQEINAGGRFYRTNLSLNDLNTYDINDEGEYEKRQLALKIRFAMLETGVTGNDIYKAAKNLSELLKDDEKHNNLLRYRIMFGSDYPMFEGTEGVKGVVNYQSSTFIFYQLLTHMLGNKWDAWHQFTVINPLIFLGLIRLEDKKNEHDYFTIQTEKFSQFKENLIFFNNSRKLSNILDRTRLWDLPSKDILESKMNKQYEELIKVYNKVIIPKSDFIIDIKGNMILTGEKKNANR